MRTRAAAKLAGLGIETLIAPPVNYALAEVANCFVGNITLRYETVVAVVKDICAGLGRWGFRRIFVMCGHAEPRNAQAIREAAENAMRRDPSLMVVVSDWLLGSNIQDLLQCEHPEWDLHAGESETALMLNRRPDLVDRIPFREVGRRQRLHRLRRAFGLFQRSAHRHGRNRAEGV